MLKRTVNIDIEIDVILPNVKDIIENLPQWEGETEEFITKWNDSATVILEKLLQNPRFVSALVLSTALPAVEDSVNGLYPEDCNILGEILSTLKANPEELETLCLKNLEDDATQDTIWETFANFGKVKEIRHNVNIV